MIDERFVLDLDAFGPDGNRITPKQYSRLLGRARWLDSRGHLLIEAVYTPEQAALEDVDYYVDYLLTNHREGLLAFCFREEPSDEDVREALLNSFAAVREIADGASDLSSWRAKYFFSTSSYERRVTESSGILGGGDLQTIYRGLTRVPSTSRRCYGAIGPRIIDLLEQDGLDAEEEALIRGCAYTTAVVHANFYVAQKLAFEQRSGVLEDAVHVRLDDDWQAGGIWRAERVEDADHYSLKTLPATLPLGLGYSETAGVAAADVELAVAAPELGASQLSFTGYLTKRDRALGRLQLTPEAAAALAPGDVDVRLVHDSNRDGMSVERDGNHLYGIEWPWSCHPGIVLRCNIESGMSVVKVRTEPAVPPIRIDGAELRFQTNEAVYRHEMGLEELTAAEKRSAPSLTELIHCAFRTGGRDRDGARELTLSELASIVLGPAWRPGDTRSIAEALAAMGLERDGAAYVWRARVTRRTRVADRSLLEAYGEARPGRRLARIVHRHSVPMHLRRLRGKHKRPHPDKVRTYGDARRQYGMHGVLIEELPPGYTWVEPHERGGAGEELTMSQLDAAFDGDEEESAEEIDASVRDQNALVDP
ncbi:MAG: hypothetical protein H0U00_07450 [Actinobacteria bacterium]|nr:hypothetical protein [Actinomycetota bacterium]